MVSTRRSPTVRRRQLSMRLRTLREQDGRTAKQVAEALDWPASKLSAMERNEWKLPSVRDIEDLGGEYGLDDDSRQLAELVELAREGRQRGWWHPYSKMLSEAYSTYIGLEAGAASVLTFEQVVVPGILQTEEYARALLAAAVSELSADEIERRIQVRMKRQELLAQDDALRVWAIMDEAVLRRLVGGTGVMRRQMQHLVEMAELPRVTLQVIKFDKGAHAAPRGPFTILEFPDPDDIDAVYVDNPAGELFVEEDDQVKIFTRTFQKLVAIADDSTATIGVIADVASGKK